MKTEIILFDSESYDPHKHKKYYVVESPPRYRLLVLGVGLMFGAIFGLVLLVRTII